MESKTLVRAYGDEPVWMCYFVNDDGNMMVHRPDSDQSIPYPRKYLYEADRGRFDALIVAYSAGDKESLEELWAGAVRLREALG